MEPVSITIITYVSLKLIDQFIKEEGYGRIKKFFFPQTKYKNQLNTILNHTIKEYENLYPFIGTSNQFPFYHSKILFENINSHVLFKTQYTSFTDLLDIFRENPNIKIPTTEELSRFYQLLVKNINDDKILRKLFFDENYKSRIFEISEALSRIETKIDNIHDKVNSLTSLFSFEPSKEWFLEQNQSSILDLGSRYTPELNFELEISNIFEGLGRTNDYKKNATKLFDVLLIKGKKVLKDNPDVKENIDNLLNLFDEINKLFSSVDFSGNSNIPIQKFNELIKAISKATENLEKYYREEENKIQKEKNDYRYYHKYGYELRNVNEFQFSLDSFKKFINGETCQLANNPFLILDGEAGIGKSHMLGDMITKRIKNFYESVFILGQQFVSDDDPWTQIFKKLQLTLTTDTFLTALNQRAQDTGKRIIIFIDAINEGRGKYFWNDNVKSFINEIKKYEWVGLVLTIRTSYKNLIFPETEIKKLNIIQHTLFGFRNNEYEASKLFFNNYKIELPDVPLLLPNFKILFS